LPLTREMLVVTSIEMLAAIPGTAGARDSLA